jgi:hypothetical protein
VVVAGADAAPAANSGPPGAVVAIVVVAVAVAGAVVVAGALAGSVPASPLCTSSIGER